jgi:hypothetical protein
MKQHVIADAQTKKQSQPRFVVRVLEPYTASQEKILDISDLAKSNVEENKSKPQDSLAAKKQPMDLSQAIVPDIGDKEDGKVADKAENQDGQEKLSKEKTDMIKSKFQQSSQIVESIFGKDAEEAVSMDGQSADAVSDDYD